MSVAAVANILPTIRHFFHRVYMCLLHATLAPLPLQRLLLVAVCSFFFLNDMVIKYKTECDKADKLTLVIQWVNLLPYVCHVLSNVAHLGQVLQAGHPWHNGMRTMEREEREGEGE